MSEHAEREALARGFFQPPNLIEWDAYQGGRLPAATAQRVNPWIERLLRGAEPVLLPMEQTDATTWYAAAKTPRAFRHLREEIMAFVGRTYSDFGGQPTHLDASLPSERALMEAYGTHVIRFRVPPEYCEKVWGRLALFLRLRDEAPKRPGSVSRPTGRILADFEEALRLGEESEADRCIEELATNGLLDAQNLLYLRIRVDEARGRWQDVVDAAGRYNLLQTSRRPRRIDQAILRAIYATEWAAFECRSDAAAALARFSEVGSRVEPLLTARRLYDCPEADALFVMSAVVRASTRADAEPLLDTFEPDAAHRPWLARLVATLPEGNLERVTPAAAEITPLLQARNAHWEGDLDRAWSLVRELPSGEAAAQIVIRCAWDLGTLDAAEFALEALESLAPDTQVRLLASNSTASAVQHLRRLVGPVGECAAADTRARVPQNWLDWAEALAIDQSWADAAELARRGSDEWDANEFASPEHARKLAECLSRFDENGWQRISESLPYILSSLGRCAKLPRQMGSVLEHLTSIHLMDEAPGRLFFATLASLCDAALTVGISELAYGDLLRETLSALEKAGAADCDGLLEFLDVLVTHATPDASLRSAVAGAIADLFVRFRRKTDAVQLELLLELLSEAACEIPAPLKARQTGPGTGEGFAALAGLRIALYSLKETALHRVATLLGRVVPAARVTTFHDIAGGSKALRAAARGADIFVVATAAASHAATGFIEAERPAGAPILRPAGQGSASMLRALRDFLETAEGSTGGT